MAPRKSTTDPTSPAGTAPAAAKTPAKIARPQRIKDVAYIEALMRLAEVYYKGGMAPKGCNRAESVAAIIEVGRDVGLSDSQALANIMLVNGRPTIWGDGGMALIRSSGLLEDAEDSFVGEPDEDSYGCTVRLKRVGAERDRIVTFTVAEAKRAGLWSKKGPWQEYPERMLRWRALGFACRNEFPDVLCGLIFAEEAYDTPASYSSGPQAVASEATAAAAVPVEAADDAALSALATEVATAPIPADAVPVDEPIGPTDDQAAILTGLRSFVIAERVPDVNDAEAAKAAWLDVLKPYGVATVKDLPRSKIDALIADLRSKHDPFEGRQSKAA